MISHSYIDRDGTQHNDIFALVRDIVREEVTKQITEMRSESMEHLTTLVRHIITSDRLDRLDRLED